ncbi:hypothetical protein XMM379_002182 [Aliiroseovarius sp. xm-m-379]|uniref:hypothetical protein n=1 Tax=Aliiroseovarius TaxID=1658781 RepID=UPI001568132C|nr:MULTISPECIES: hypothetical protein [Aliiroseovarius]NRP13871.1 hypothetical protein [Aliiroseovarius sp. xm-d-517]NRP25484.1 hypothetical protein [Aliiroseovarius sp. xm-m-379]NRP29477.1 hypothetical protein [Aliiroseovarius sp. xm-m-314]NRP34283.1 hypothetical protein [Aliiroseovarius sp. xm-a-104]NRP41758.1 hypothetical protein [Aliiroseovarius sp. xm-m-339-2]
MKLEPRLEDQTVPDLEPGEKMLAQFQGNRTTYIKEHVMLAAIGSVVMVVILLAIKNPFPWTGVVGAVLAIALRGAYLLKEQTGFIWTLTNRRLIGPTGSAILLHNIEAVNTIFTAAQVVTIAGDKHMLKYQADAKDTKAQINRARGAA